MDAGPTFVLEVSPIPTSLSIARLFAASVARRCGCADGVVEDIKLAISEALTNAVKAHEAISIDDQIRIAARVEDAGIAFEVVDAGGGFDVLEVPADTGMTPAPGLYEGSLGLTVIRSLFPKVEIARNEARGMTVSFLAECTPVRPTG